MTAVRDVMTRSVLTVQPSTPLKDVARMLIDNRISGLPVVDADGVVVGVVSEADFLVKEQGAEAISHRPLAMVLGHFSRSRAELAKVVAASAGQAMTSPAITIEPDRPVSEAARTMTASRVNRLPVVDRGRLVGIVTRSDLVQAFVRSDEELAATIRDDVLLHTLWLDPARFTVEVRNGVASIVGRVERRSTAEMVERAVGMVPGIVGVMCQVNWAMDDRDVGPVTADPVFPFGPR
jgi:CBS domain-containing protein